MYFVYAIYNRKHSKVYIGQTKSLKERLRLHNSKEFINSYTFRFDREWILIYQEQCENRPSIKARETIKKLQRTGAH